MSLHIDDHVDLWVDHKTAIDTIEPIPDRHDELRDYALRSVEILNGFSAWLEKPIVAPSGTKQSIAIAFYQAAFALGLTAVNSDTMTSVAARLGVSRATISKGAVTFAQAHGLDPSFHMKVESSSQAYCVARLAVVSASSNGNGESPPPP